MGESLQRDKWPETLYGYYSVAGVYVGGCVSGAKSFRAKAHAHTEQENGGWICFLSAKRLADDALVIHELAHVLTGQGHTDGWRKMVVALGGTLSETDSLMDYHKRGRVVGKFAGLGKPHHPECPCAR